MNSQLKNKPVSILKNYLVFLYLVLFSLPTFGQTDESAQIVTPTNLKEYLVRTISFPKDGRGPADDCDLVLELEIQHNGELSSIKNVSDCGDIYYNETVFAIGNLQASLWQPKISGDSTITSKQLLVVKFRKTVDSTPVNYLADTKKLLKKEKYEKALKQINKGIAEHPFNSQYYTYRSLVQQELNDPELALEDQQKVEELNNKVFTIVPINLVGVSRTINRTTTRSLPR